ncbi:linker for activation of T-cells family member 1 [Tenrec ecaudatus]|uniref:linker for activation of T-cells family member 1 n=1 Tax=Tenrec ecaudatus TaxID=94439 RepID=UPI003F5A3CB6
MEAAVVSSAELGLLLLPFLTVLLLALCLRCRELPASYDSASPDSVGRGETRASWPARASSLPLEAQEGWWRPQSPLQLGPVHRHHRPLATGSHPHNPIPFDPARRAPHPEFPTAPCELPPDASFPAGLGECHQRGQLRERGCVWDPRCSGWLGPGSWGGAWRLGSSLTGLTPMSSPEPACEDMDEDEEDDEEDYPNSEGYLEVLPDSTPTTAAAPRNLRESACSMEDYVNVPESEESAEASLDGSREYVNVSQELHPQVETTEPAPLSSQEMEEEEEEEEEEPPDYENLQDLN